jgi:steroid 5-alpha reductase family enzyme
LPEALFLPALAALLLVLVMAGVWRVAVRIRNAGIVDVAWSANFGLLALLAMAQGRGHLPRRLLIGGMTLLWSLRLAVYLYRRVMGHHPVEDGRYVQLRRDWAPHADRRFFWFFELQAALNLVLAAPFRRDPANRGKTCRAGLWRYSRHPNYFFEWLVWVAYFVFALASPWGWATVYCPALMLTFLFRVTGIPATEAQALKSRGDDYREYQRTTSAFFPWFPRG